MLPTTNPELGPVRQAQFLDSGNILSVHVHPPYPDLLQAQSAIAWYAATWKSDEIGRKPPGWCCIIKMPMNSSCGSTQKLVPAAPPNRIGQPSPASGPGPRPSVSET